MVAVLAAVIWLALLGNAHADSLDSVPRFLNQYCLDCHNTEDAEGGLDLASVAKEQPSGRPEVWEAVVGKLRSRHMPPLDVERPSEADYDRVVTLLTDSLDRHAEQHPNPGRTASFRRLTRTEYQNAIRDLLALEIDVTELLPGDQASQGFDNVTVSNLSPTHLERYLSAAEEISRLAVGGKRTYPDSRVVRLPGDLTQERHVDGLPLGTRGGRNLSHYFPRDGKYEISVRLTRDRNDEVEGLRRSHDLEFLIDNDPIASFQVAPPRERNDHHLVDAHLNGRFRVAAGRHHVGVTFLADGASLLETRRQPYVARFNMHRHPRSGPAIYQVSITGPFDDEGPGDTPSRRKIFVHRPSSDLDTDPCAERILTPLLRTAYRRPLMERDLSLAMKFFREGLAERDFEYGIERAISSILVNPNFLFRMENDPRQGRSERVYSISDVELASRLSFFLWSSLPDDKLLDLAEQNRLSDPEELAKQVKRMLADERASSLSTNFAAQWLQLRNLESAHPNLRLFPDFDDNLRQSFRAETERFVADIVSHDRSVLDLVQASDSYLNERLARHYGIAHIYGNRLRHVDLGQNRQRGGVLRHGSLLTVTSYATRTSPVIRGNWLLENLLGSPAPPPPEDVPELTENTVSSLLPLRERLEQHRADVTCASCHDLIDPIGFALENYDAIGRWRELDEGHPIDVTGFMPDGKELDSVEALEDAMLARPELFVHALTSKLLTYALGRPVEYYDAPAIRRVIQVSAEEDYRFSAVITAIVTSVPFRMRNSE